MKIFGHREFLMARNILVEIMVLRIEDYLKNGLGPGNMLGLAVTQLIFPLSL